MTDSAGGTRGGGAAPPIDFDAVARAALDAAGRLVPQWLPDGKVIGCEYTCGSLAGGKGDSCKVNLATGRWADFATDDRGADLISLYAAVHGIKQGAAARAIAAELSIETHEPGGARSTDARSSQGTAGKPSAKQARQPSGKPAGDEEPDADAWHDAGAWPADGPPPPVAHRYRGKPAASWAYRDALGRVVGWVHRFTTSAGGKEILPCVWSRHAQHGLAWKWRAFDVPRPLYARDALARGNVPDQWPSSWPQVLVVEGEKCAEAVQPLLPDWAVTTWPGGSKAVAKAHWEQLAGRRVVIWPDADAKRDREGALKPEQAQPGVAAAEQIAAELRDRGCGCDVQIVCIPAPGERADGWDVADLIAECAATGADAAAAVRHWRDPARLRRPACAQADAAAVAPNPSGAAPAKTKGQRRAIAQAAVESAVDAEGADPAWRTALVWGRDGLERHPANIIEILRNDARWRDVVAFDEFAQCVVKRREPPYYRGAVGEWRGEDDTRTAVWMAQQYNLMVNSKQVIEAVETVARERSFHPVVAHLRGLAWDGERRNEHWLSRYAGVPDSPYVRAVSTLFLRGMVRRVLQPGCKFDYCLVLEGVEGLRKSTLATTLGLAWGSDTPLDLANNREAALALHGNWVVEFSEMESVTRAEAHLQKSFLSRTFDQYRPFWSGRNTKVPRQCVFVGTTNETEYIKEGQGARRFWPVSVTSKIDIDGLRRAMPQLLAEAVADVDAGERCWPSDDEQAELFRPEQMKRVQQESLIDALHDWVIDPGMDEIATRGVNGGAFSLADAAFRCLKVSYAQLTRDLQSRIGKALAALGCERLEKRNGMTRYWYKPPSKKAATSSTAPQPAQPSAEADDDLPF